MRLLGRRCPFGSHKAFGELHLMRIIVMDFATRVVIRGVYGTAWQAAL
jgi:hypothetical protein